MHTIQRADTSIPILFFGNVPPPFGGVSSYFAFMIPLLLKAGFTPVILVWAGEDYSHWREIGAFIYRFPHEAQDQAREAAEFHQNTPAADLEKCRELNAQLSTLIEKDRFYSDLNFARRIGELHSVKMIHTFHAIHRSVVALALKQICGLPAVLTILGEVVAEYSLRPEIHPQLRWMLKQFDALLATSNHCASGADLIGMHHDEVKVIPYGIDTAFFRRVDESDLKARHNLNGKQVILFQGRVSAEKGPQVLLEALPEVFKHLPNTIVLLVGPDEGNSMEGPTGLGVRLEDRVTELQLQDRVIFTGAVPFEELPPYFSVADVLVFPSTTPKECMGLAMKQAMACGVPVVAARAGGACEAIVDGVTGFCCEPNDPIALATALIRLLTSQEREAMGRAAYERAMALFTEERTLGSTVELYHALLGHSQRSRREP